MVLRLQKYMSECGICSRRHAEEAIARGDVIVNGQVARIGQSIDPEADKVEFAGQMVKRSEALVYYAMNKPRGVETTSAQRDGQSIIDIVDIPTRVFPIGRLDKDSSGLILLTNDGRITHRLLHPSFEHEKEYLVTTYGKIDDHVIQALRAGVRYSISEGPKTETSAKFKVQSAKWRNFNNSDKKGTGHINNPQFWTLPFALWTRRNSVKFVQTNPCEVKRVSSDTFTIILTEGKNRQIRRMVEACGHQVKRLKRIRIEHILLADLPDGAYRELKRGEREELLRRAALPLVDFAPLVGEVVHGDGRGHEIGFPTANIVVPAGTFPDKTFSCRVKVGERLFLGAGTYNSNKKVAIVASPRSPFQGGEKVRWNIGGMVMGVPTQEVGVSYQSQNPLYPHDVSTPIAIPLPSTWNEYPLPPRRINSRGTVALGTGEPGDSGTGGLARECWIFEVHIINFDEDIYGQTLHVEIMDTIRDNRSFKDIVELKSQIEKDVNHVRAHWRAVLSAPQK